MLSLCLVSMAAPLGGLAQAARGDVGVELSPAVFPTLSQLVSRLVPQNFQIPDSHSELLSCPFGSAIALDISQASLALTLGSLDITPADAALAVATKLDLSGGAHVKLTNAVACLGSLECDIAVSATSAGLSSTLGLSVTSGQVAASVQALGVDLQPSDLHLELSNCLLADVPQSVVNWLTGKIFDHEKASLIAQASIALPPLVTNQLQNVMGTSGMLSGYAYSAQITDVALKQLTGMEGYVTASVSYPGAAMSCFSKADALTDTSSTGATAADLSGVSMANAPPAPVQIGVSQKTLRQALTAAWQSGMMCVDQAAMAKLGFDPSGLAAMVPGMPKGTTLSFTLGLSAAPEFSTDAQANFWMRSSGTELQVSLQAPGADPAEIDLAADISLGIALDVDADHTGYIRATLADMRIDNFTITGGKDGALRYSIDPSRLQVLLTDLVVPMAKEKLGQMALSPAAFSGGPALLGGAVYVWLDAVTARAEGMYAGLHPFLAPTNDAVLPATSIAMGPGVGKAKFTRPGRLSVLASGSDDQTPPQLMRYTWQLDNGPESDPAFGAEIFVPVTTEGSHQVRVRAIDLNSNRDLQQQLVSFTVDATPPTLTVTNSPAVVIHASSTSLDFTGSDDKSDVSKLTYAYRLTGAPVGQPVKPIKMVAPSPLTAGAGHIDVSDLQNGGVYQLTLMLYDEAGNVTSSAFTIAVEDGGGCSLSGGVAGAFGENRAFDFGLGMLLLLALSVASRRRLHE